MFGAQKAQRAQAQAIEDEQKRQRRLQQEAMGHVKDSTATAGRTGTDRTLGQALDARSAQYGAPTPGSAAASAPLPGASGAPAIVGREQGRAIASADSYGAQQALQKAVLDAWGDASLHNKIAVSRNGSKIGMIGGFENGSMGVLPLELQSASNAGGGLRMIGDLLVKGGQAAGMAGSGLADAGTPLTWSDINPWAATASKATGSIGMRGIGAGPY